MCFETCEVWVRLFKCVSPVKLQLEPGMIVHLCQRSEWENARKTGFYRAASLETEGFIHCSRPDQVLAVANAFYRGVPDLVLLWIDPERVAVEVRWEAPIPPGTTAEERVSPHGGGDFFPHIYGPLNVEAVMRVTPFRPDSDGIFKQVLV